MYNFLPFVIVRIISEIISILSKFFYKIYYILYKYVGTYYRKQRYYRDILILKSYHGWNIIPTQFCLLRV